MIRNHPARFSSCASFVYWFILGLSLPTATADAAEIKALSAAAVGSVMRDLIPEFERTSGHKVVINYNSAGAIQRQVRSGEPADVVITTGAALDELQRQTMIVSGSRVDVASVGIGIAVRTGAQKPDISSADAFKKSLLAARTIAHGNPAGGSAVGIYAVEMFERLGLLAEMKPKTKLLGDRPLAEAVAKGEVEIGIAQISQIVPWPGIELVGPLPPGLQNITLFAAGVGAGSKEPGAAKALIQFVTSPSAIPVIKAKGMVSG
jgi:molybdate transport system substrate-binding protein